MPIARPSLTARKLSAVTRLLRHFIACPAPSGPRWNTALPMQSSSGRTRSRSAAAPPHMKTSSAAFAPHSAPETGASIIATPASSSMRPVASVSQGSDDEVSSSSAPGLRPRSRPSSPATSACTTAPFGTIVTTMSLRAASSAGVRRRVRADERRGDVLGAARRGVVERQRVAGGGEMRGHRPAHDAETDEAERRFARVSSSFRVYEEACGRPCVPASSRSMQASTARPRRQRGTIHFSQRLDRPSTETTP